MKYENDVTEFHLGKVIANEVPGLKALASNLAKVQIDRVLQAFIDNNLMNVTSSETALMHAGEISMGIKIKKFLSNLDRISTKLQDEVVVDDDEFLNLVSRTSISENDLKVFKMGGNE